MSYGVCINVKSNVPTDRKQCFVDFGLVSFAKKIFVQDTHKNFQVGRTLPLQY